MNVSPKATISNNFALCILNYAFDCLACVSKLNNHLYDLYKVLNYFAGNDESHY